MGTTWYPCSTIDTVVVNFDQKFFILSLLIASGLSRQKERITCIFQCTIFGVQCTNYSFGVFLSAHRRFLSLKVIFVTNEGGLALKVKTITINKIARVTQSSNDLIL